MEVGFFRAMGADSVAYHEETVVGRGDDHPGRALDYYGERGETPLRWGGRLATELGLTGEVTPEAYRAAFGSGGFRLPATGEQLTRVKRPGFEIVVGPHKSVAILGLVDRAEDMHAMLDAETTATLDVLERYWMTKGGTRGREQRRTPTSGLAWAVTRHGTTRAGDPHPHDHVLVLNLVHMLDDKGGYKALDSAALRDMLEAATMVGRLHAAAKAIELGYEIEVDGGKGGRARKWRIAGIPDEVCELFSKRADEITRYLEERGQSSYRARNVAARATRDVKRHTGVDELMPEWHAELAAAGWPIERLAAHLEAARSRATGLRPALTDAEVDRIVADLMDPASQFHTRRKVFARWQLVAEIAPLLYGHDPAELDRVMTRVLGSDLVVPLIGGTYSRDQVYASSLVLATEQHIAARIDHLASRPGPAVSRELVRDSLTRKESEVGRPLTAGQRAAVENICGPTGAVKVIVGVAGSGKTTALDAATTALTAAGYEVVGTATSGQAARTLAAAAGIDARTTRSLLRRLDHGHLTLTDSSVVVLDETGMTADADLARILHAAARRHATVVLVGDPRQLAPVGPGGALAATLQEHPEIVTAMRDNVRQRDPAERDALLEIRHGNVDRAVDWYADNDRIDVHVAQLDALHQMTEAWAADVATGHDTLMLAWRRDTVAALNRFARAAAGQAGRLQGDDLIAPGGRPYATGDQVVTLTPNYRGDLVTSQRARVTHVDHERQALTLRTDDGRQVRLAGAEIDTNHLDHGYALTVHRTQGATADRVHFIAEGGGRELAYVALSRARDRTTIHTVADDLDQALDDLRYQWTQPQSQDWVTLTHERDVGQQPAASAAIATPPARDRIVAELAHLNRQAPPDRRRWVATQQQTLTQLRRDRTDLNAARGRWSNTPEAHAIRAVDESHHRLQQAKHTATTAGRFAAPRARAALREAHLAADIADQAWSRIVRPTLQTIDETITTARRQLDAEEQAQQTRATWLAAHPIEADQIRTLERALLRHDNPTRAATLDRLDRTQRALHRDPTPAHELGL